jgi:hypothetical protein
MSEEKEEEGCHTGGEASPAGEDVQITCSVTGTDVDMV